MAFKVHSMTLAFLWIIARIIRFDEYWERRCHFKSCDLTIVLLRSLGSAPSPITLKKKKLDSSQTTFNLNQGGTLENIKRDSSPIILKTKHVSKKQFPKNNTCFWSTGTFYQMKTGSIWIICMNTEIVSSPLESIKWKLTKITYMNTYQNNFES